MTDQFGEVNEIVASKGFEFEDMYSLESDEGSWGPPLNIASPLIEDKIYHEDNSESGNEEKPKRRRRKRARLTGLSQQRQAANARERSRTKCVHAALLELRCHIPTTLPEENGKLSKIEILRLASSYIGQLTAVLHAHDPVNFCSPDKIREMKEMRITDEKVDGLANTNKTRSKRKTSVGWCSDRYPLRRRNKDTNAIWSAGVTKEDERHRVL